jgi:SAM-dependent methyltransferase
MILSEEGYQRARPFRSRGLESLRARVGDLLNQIEDMRPQDRKLRILEVGAGFGTTLLQLQSLYHEQVELYGINRYRRHGDHSLMLRNARELGIQVETANGVPLLPDISYCDVGQAVPFPDNFFDLIYSQNCVVYIADKINLFHELGRVLQPNGVALLDFRDKAHSRPSPYDKWIEIWHSGGELDFARYVDNRSWLAFNEVKGRQYLKISRRSVAEPLPSLTEVVELWKISPEWHGVKSIYRF